MTLEAERSPLLVNPLLVATPYTIRDKAVVAARLAAMFIDVACHMFWLMTYTPIAAPLITEKMATAIISSVSEKPIMPLKDAPGSLCLLRRSKALVACGAAEGG
jgi:hypothetical protein